MLGLHNACRFLGSFSDYTIFIWKFKIDESFLFMKRFQFTIGNIKNCNEVKTIMVMSIAIIYIFLSYVMFDQQLKITSTKSSGSPEKIHYPLFTYSPLKIQKVQVPPFLPTLKNFQPPPLQKGGEDTMVEAIWGKLQLNWKDIFNLFTASKVSSNSDYLCNTEQNRN